MDKFRFAKALTILLCMSFQAANAQIQGCSPQGIEIQECLDQAANSASMESCCKALNHAVQAGYYCLCLLLRSSTPLLGITLSLQLSNCDVSVPPLTQCQKVLPVFHAPDTSFPRPAIDNPPVPARPLPVEMPSEVPKQLLQPSTPNDFMVPLPPKRNEIPLNSTPTNEPSIAAGQTNMDTDFHPEFGIPRLGNMKSHGGDKLKVFLHPTLFLSVALCAMMSAAFQQQVPFQSSESD